MTSFVQKPFFVQKIQSFSNLWKLYKDKTSNIKTEATRYICAHFEFCASKRKVWRCLLLCFIISSVIVIALRLETAETNCFGLKGKNTFYCCLIQERWKSTPPVFVKTSILIKFFFLHIKAVSISLLSKSKINTRMMIFILIHQPTRAHSK